MAKSDEDLPQPNTHHSPASTLSPDVLSLIFQHACTLPDLNRRHGLPPLVWFSDPPSPSEKKTQFALSAVSVYWRQVSTLLTPYIWTSVDLVVSPATVHRASVVLQAFLTHSGQLPLAIALRFDISWKFDTEVLVDTISDKLFFQNTHRICGLHLIDLPDTWTNLFPSLSNLAHLSIQQDSISSLRLVMIKSQCSSLTLKLVMPRLSCPNLTVLHLYAVDIDFCLELLMTCRNLIEFRNRNPQEGEEGTLLTDSLVLPSMEVFEWPMNTRYETDLAMLQHLHMPSLKELIWFEEDHESFHPMDPAEVFFQNLPSTLTHLHIHNAFVESGQLSLISVFDVVPGSLNIECLTLSNVDGLFLGHVFERLTPALDTAGSQQRVKLPKLKAILIEENLGITESDQDKVLQMLGCRFLDVGAPNQEPLRIGFPSQVELSPEFKEKLKEMTGRGLKVEIFKGAKLVDEL